MRKKSQTITHRLRARKLHKHPFAVPVVTLIILSFITLIGSVVLGGQTLNASDTHVVQLSLGGKKQVLPTRATTVEDFLARSNVTLNEGDVVEPSKETIIVEDNFRVNVYRARPVTVFDGNKRIQALSAATTPRSVVAQVGVQVYPEDKLKQEVSDNVLKDQVIGEKIVIDRAMPVNLNLYGTPVTVRTHSKTVGDLLKEKNVTVANGDTVQPSATTALTPDMQIFVTRFGTQIITTDEPIPMETQIVEDATLSFGATAVRQAGSPGKKVVTYQLELQNGKEVGRHIIQEVRVTEPVTQIKARGKAFNISVDKEAVMAAAGIAPSDYPYVNYIVSHEGGWNGTTRYNSAGSGAYGLCQALPGSKMASAGSDWQTNPVTQLKWCSGYATARYGSWGGAYNYWLSHNYW
ncbi:MAG TPA: ubiquitin-like domain-containing protein [Candidatus Limnocylindrales bacterium]|nr:ubiquitin-like domain-containing protein [Candidatus Limnocylindrales bacterium]